MDYNPDILAKAGAYVWVLVIAWFGGITNYLAKMKTGEVGRFNFTEFLGDMVTSSFSGVIAFFLCQGAGFNEWISAAITGVSGHMGSRAIFFLERVLERRYGVPPEKKNVDNKDI